MNYVDTWSLDPCEREVIKKNINDFLLQFEGVYLNLVNKILEKLTIININKFNSQAIAFKKNIKKFVSEHKNLGIFCVVNESEKPHHSYGFLHYFSGMNNVRTSIYNKENSVYEFIKYEEVLLVDDYSGSGQSICDAIKLINDNSTNKKSIYISCMHMTSIAKRNISNYIEDNTLEHIDLFFEDSWTCFRNDFIKECCMLNEVEISQFEKMCLDVCGLKKEEVYGYRSVGDGISFVNWTPNTTIPLLWKNGKKYVPIFSRTEYPFGKKKFWKNADITKLKSISINGMPDTDSAVAFMLIAGYTNEEIIRINRLNKEKLEKIISSLCIQKYIEYFEYDNSKIFIEGMNYFNLIDKEKYYKFIHGVNVEKTVKINLISAIENRN